MPDEPGDDDAKEETTDRARLGRTNDEKTKIGFSLPPITLPPLRLPSLGLPADFSPIPPMVPRVRGSANRVLAALAIDSLDIIVVLVVGGGFARVTVGAILAVGLVSPLGVVYAWELLPVIGGIPWIGIVPSATIIVVADRYRTQRN